MIRRTVCCAVIALIAAGAAADVDETFSTGAMSPWDGIGDGGQQWFGDVGELKSTTNNMVASINDDSGPKTIVTDTGAFSGPVKTWFGVLGEENNLSLNVNGSNWGGIILSSSTNDATAIENGNMTGLRVVYLNGDFLRLEQASGSGWSTLSETATSVNIRRTEITVVLDGTNLTFSGRSNINLVTGFEGIVTLGSHSFSNAPALEQYSGMIVSMGGSRNHMFESFSLVSGDEVPVNVVDQTYVGAFGSTNITIAAPGVLDGSFNALSATVVTNVTDGTLNLNADGSFSFDADPGFEGTNTFAFAGVNGTATSTPAIATLIVTLTESDISTTNDNYLVDLRYYTDITVSEADGVLANDSYDGINPVYAEVVNPVANGALTFNSNGSFTYTPDPLFEGVEQFTYQAYTIATTSSLATVSISVSNVVPSILLHYSFDTDLSDSSGNGNHGTAEGTNTSISATSIFGTGSLASTGEGYVSFDDISFESAEDWSISMWINCNDTNNTYELAGRDGFIDYTFRKDGSVPNRQYYLRTGHRTDNATFDTGNAIDTNTWHHLVITCVGNGNVVTLYEDGVAYGGWPAADDTKMIFDFVGELNGLVDEVWIANYAFAPFEVNQLYVDNMVGPAVNNPAAVLGWEIASSDTMKMTINLNAQADPAAYYPMGATDLVTSNWAGVAHSDAAAGTYAVGNLAVAADEGTNKVIYVKSTNTVEFFRIDIVE